MHKEQHFKLHEIVDDLGLNEAAIMLANKARVDIDWNKLGVKLDLSIPAYLLSFLNKDSFNQLQKALSHYFDKPVYLFFHVYS